MNEQQENTENRSENSQSASPPAKNLNQQTLIDRAIAAGGSTEQATVRERVIDALRTVYDPEIPVNIYELGLVYDIDISADNHVNVRMTLTAPGCPVAGSLPGEVQAKIQQIPEVAAADVELVWDPPWDRSRMSETAALELGLM